MNDLSIGSTLPIGHGIEMPRLGLGTYKSAPGEDTAESVRYALELGYRQIDTAALYANEASVADGIERAGLSRDDVFITTKLWNTEQGYKSALAALERSLYELRTDHVDLYLVHWPMREHMEGTWRAMEEALESGKARAIGVSNFLPHHLEELLRIAHVAPAVDQVEFHPRLQQPSLQAYLAEHDIALVAWAPLMRGAVCTTPEIVTIAARLGRTPAQVTLRWILESGHVAIPKSVHADRIAENAGLFDFELTEADHEVFARLDTGTRVGPDPDTYAW